MPPQPLSRVHPGAKVEASAQTMIARSDLSKRISEIISLWSYTEANIGSILAYLIHAEAAATLAMLQAIRAATAQMDVIEAAAEAKLIDPELETFQAVLRIARAAAKKRNKIAHHIWAHTDKLPNALLLIEPAGYQDLFVKIQEATRLPANVFVETFKNIDFDPAHTGAQELTEKKSGSDWTARDWTARAIRPSTACKSL